MDEHAEASGPSRRIPTVGIFVIAFLLLLSGVFVVGQLSTEDGPAGEAAPDVELPILDADGELTATLTLSELRGTPVVVNFFAAWCTPCIVELPAFEEVHQELGDRVTFLGIDVNDRVADALRLIDETGITYPVVYDRAGTALGEFNDFEIMPTTAFVAADGTLAHVNPGIISGEDLRATIEEKLLTGSTEP